MILAGDVGATKILLEVGDFRSGRWESGFERRFPAEGVTSIAPILKEFLDAWKAGRPPRARITAAGFGVAGPQVGNRVKMTNRPFTVDGDAIARRFGIPRVRVVNDMAAAAFGVDALSPRDMVGIQAGKAAPHEARVVIGVGTGLGVAYVVPRGESWQIVPGEGGHAGFSPVGEEQAQLWRALADVHGRVEAEHVISGRGLSNIYEFLRRRGNCPVGAPECAEAEWITEAAFERRDPLCLHAVDLFVQCLGNVAGDHALAVMARGGLYFTGSVTANLLPALKSTAFAGSFCAKGMFAPFLMKVPVRVVTSPRVAVTGAARWASEA